MATELAKFRAEPIGAEIEANVAVMLGEALSSHTFEASLMTAAGVVSMPSWMAT